MKNDNFKKQLAIKLKDILFKYKHANSINNKNLYNKLDLSAQRVHVITNKECSLNSFCEAVEKLNIDYSIEITKNNITINITKYQEVKNEA